MNHDDTQLIKSLASLEQSIKGQGETNERVSTTLEKLEVRITSLEATFNQAKGGWLVIIAIPAIITALVNWIIRHP